MLISVLGDTKVQSAVMAAQVDAGYDLITLEAWALAQGFSI